jgi:hypothetical protein
MAEAPQNNMLILVIHCGNESAPVPFNKSEGKSRKLLYYVIVT